MLIERKLKKKNLKREHILLRLSLVYFNFDVFDVVSFEYCFSD